MGDGGWRMENEGREMGDGDGTSIMGDGRWKMGDIQIKDGIWENLRVKKGLPPPSPLLSLSPDSQQSSWSSFIITINTMIITSLSLSSPSTSMMIIMVIMNIIVMSTRVTSLSLSSPTLSLPQHSKWESLAASNWAARQPQYWPCSSSYNNFDDDGFDYHYNDGADSDLDCNGFLKSLHCILTRPASGMLEA